MKQFGHHAVVSYIKFLILFVQIRKKYSELVNEVIVNYDAGSSVSVLAC